MSQNKVTIFYCKKCKWSKILPNGGAMVPKCNNCQNRLHIIEMSHNEFEIIKELIMNETLSQLIFKKD